MGDQIVSGVATTVAAYGFGCVVAGWYLVRWRTGADLRQLGSGSVGGRNTSRVVGLRWAAVGVAVDVVKGAVAVALALATAPGWVGVAMVAVVAGHVWPIQLGGRGGRGLAPALGAVAVAAPTVALATAATFAVLASLSRSTLVPVIVATVVAPAWAVALGALPEVVAGTAGIAVIVALGHAAPLRALATRRRRSSDDPEAVR